MADPAENTSYPVEFDPLPEIGPNDRQNAPGLEHDVIHTRAHAVLNALQLLVGSAADLPAATVLERLAALEVRGAPEHANSGSSHVLGLADAFAMVCMTSASANIVTVPDDATVPWPPNVRIDLSQDGAGQTTVAAATGVVIRTPETLKLRKRYAKASLIRRGDNLWDLEGNLEAAP